MRINMKNILLISVVSLSVNTNTQAAWDVDQCRTKCLVPSCTKDQLNECTANCSSENISVKCKQAALLVSPLSSSPLPAVSSQPKAPDLALKAKSQPSKVEQESEPKKVNMLEEQIMMLNEAVKQAQVCYKMGSDLAKEAAKDPEAFEKGASQRGKDAIFPTTYDSIFEKNPHFIEPTIDYTKMDHQSFVDQLKEQRKTVGVMLANILGDVLGWEDASKIEKYRLGISGDLRAMSSFCTQPIQILKQAVEYRKEQIDKQAAASQKKGNGIFSRIRKGF